MQVNTIDAICKNTRGKTVHIRSNEEVMTYSIRANIRGGRRRLWVDVEAKEGEPATYIRVGYRGKQVLIAVRKNTSEAAAKYYADGLWEILENNPLKY